MTELDRLSSGWANSAWTDAWQGACLMSAVWLLCRIWPSMPARGRAWLWWLVGVKFIIGLLPFTGIPLPILPNHAAHLPLTGLHIPARIAVGQGVHFECATVACSSYTNSPAFLQCIHTVGIMTRVLILGLWIFGLVVNLKKSAHGWWHAYLLRRGSVAVLHPAISFECRRLCFFVGINPPLLMESDELTSPVLTGYFKPAIILPSEMIVDCKVHDARMMLAHELAHLKRRDLLFGWVPAIAQLLNWWNPLLWVVSREWGLAQEIACDEFAVQTTAALPLHFGQMLLAMTMAGRRPQTVNAAVVGLSGEHQTLKRRLLGMRYISRRKTRGVDVGMRSIIIAVALLLIPWHPVPRDEFRAPVVHSHVALAVWHGIQSAARTCDRDLSRLASNLAGILGPRPAVAAQAIGSPKVVDLTSPSMTGATDRPDASDPDLIGADGHTDLKLTRDPNVTPTDMYNSVKTAFTPMPSRPSTNF